MVLGKGGGSNIAPHEKMLHPPSLMLSRSELQVWPNDKGDQVTEIRDRSVLSFGEGKEKRGEAALHLNV